MKILPNLLLGKKLPPQRIIATPKTARHIDKMTNPTRTQDEQLLAMLALHTQGRTPVDIARVHKTTPQTVRKKLRALITEDCLADPTAETYWRQHRV